MAPGQSAIATAQRLIASFDPGARSELLFDWDARERTRWSNLPAGFFTRPGLSIGDMSDDQRGLLFEFLSTSLGEQGYRRLSNVLAAEAFLSQAPNAARNGWYPENYWISFYGLPSDGGDWGWSFGGHHLGLNLSFRDGQVSTMSPSFVGTEPAIFRLDGVEYESVVDMHHAGHAAFLTLDPDQRELADAGRVPRDVITGPGDDGLVPQRIGISASEMSPAQRTALLAVVRLWVEIQPEGNASVRMKAIEAELDQVHFAWHGSGEVNTPVYMRIQGPSLIIELVSNGDNVGENARGRGHYHTIYRDPTFEYGRQ
ncbi:DUF3500 domain-containing protein [Arenibacterium sp. LLYu02]|uniref:DUF3500 domain-containing protein n=1 Tax=Arenibacterium sp. LLYu02 TaxID=3404132 RepID=UPI003B22718B